MRSRHPFPDVPLEPGELQLLGVDEMTPAHDEAIEVHPDYTTKGVEFPLGFMPHKGENRRTRRATTAQWVPPAEAPTRRELVRQRQKQRRGTLDVATRRLQRKARP